MLQNRMLRCMEIFQYTNKTYSHKVSCIFMVFLSVKLVNISKTIKNQ
jgi:hypothetical protein